MSTPTPGYSKEITQALIEDGYTGLPWYQRMKMRLARWMKGGRT